jgi:hypothetical protein
VLEFAGRVWQLKDGLIAWLKSQPESHLAWSDAKAESSIVFTGEAAEEAIEDGAKLHLPLMLCADLYNSHKHYADCNRSNYQPYLSGVEFDGSRVGVWGIKYDGARKIGDFTVANPNPVPWRIEILSGNHRVTFGDAVVVIGRAFHYWTPLLLQTPLFSPDDPEDHAVLEDLAEVREAMNTVDMFEPGDAAIDLGELPPEQRRIARDNPSAFVESHTHA